jgi:DNA recombination protein RmuC
METILYLIAGLLVGSIIGYLALKQALLRGYIPKSQHDDLQTRFNSLQVEIATRPSKEEVAERYVPKELHATILENLRIAHETLEKERRANEQNQSTILRLTAESEQKLTRAEVEQSYISKESFDIVNRKLTSAENEIAKREQTILDLKTQLTELQQKEEFLNEKLTTFKTELEELHKLSQEKFRNLATEVLEEKKKHFVDQNRKELSTIIDPLKTDLNLFREKIEATRKEDIQDLTSLKKEIESLQKLNVQLSDDAQNLANALKSEVKMQGSWGEDRLNMILEVEGLQRYIDFTREEQLRDTDQERIRRPDFILKLPNNKQIVIDSKVSLTAYVNYFNATSPEEKAEYLKQHLRSINDHINLLADKNYQSLAGLNTPDYVFLFMPVESALTLALNQNPEIFTNALKRKIVLITPTTLVATLKIVKLIWQKENQVKNIEEIFDACGKLYDKFVMFLEDMDKIEDGLKAATNAYSSAMYSLKNGKRKGDTIIGRFETIKNLEAKVNRQIPKKHLQDIESPGEEPEQKMLETGDHDVLTDG